MTEPTSEAHGTQIARLERSRAQLLEALTERTEGDFARSLGGDFGEETLGQALAALAQAERANVAAARAQTLPDRELPERPLPPQVTHDLAGARHQTLTALAHLEDGDTVEVLVAAITRREAALIAQIDAILGTPASE
jgi:hypothetical protein